MDAAKGLSSLSPQSSSSEEAGGVDLVGTARTMPPSTSQATDRSAVFRRPSGTACDFCRGRKIRCTHNTAATTIAAAAAGGAAAAGAATAATATASAATMEPPNPAAIKKKKEQARKAAQKKAKKAAKKSTTSASAQPEEPGLIPTPAIASAIHPAFLSTFAASDTPNPAASATNPLPATLLAEIDEDDDDKPGWRASLDTAWAQAQKNVCIRWVREKRQKVARAEKALARSTLAGRAAAEEELEEAKLELAEEIEDAIKRGCAMSELQ